MRMSLVVMKEVDLLGELLPADRAGKRALPSVHPTVALKMGGPHEPFPTLFTEMGALAVVSPLVSHQCLPTPVDLATVLAAQMGLLVFLQLRDLCKASPAGRAVVRALAHVVTPVLGQMGTLAVRLSTFRALERPLSSMDPPVPLQMGSPDETFPTVRALMGLLCSMALLMVLQG